MLSGHLLISERSQVKEGTMKDDRSTCKFLFSKVGFGSCKEGSKCFVFLTDESLKVMVDDKYTILNNVEIKDEALAEGLTLNKY